MTRFLAKNILIVIIQLLDALEVRRLSCQRAFLKELQMLIQPALSNEICYIV